MPTQSAQDIIAYLNKYSDLAKSDRFIVQFGAVPKLIAKTYSQSDIHNLSYQCEAAELPGRNFSILETRTYGPNVKSPYQSVYNDLILTFFCTGQNVSFLSALLTPIVGGAVENALGGTAGAIGGQLVSSALGGVLGSVLGSKKGGLWEKRFFDDWLESINPSNGAKGNDLYNFSYQDDYVTDVTVSQLDTSGKVNYSAKYERVWPYSMEATKIGWGDDSIMRLNIIFAYKNWHRIESTGTSGLISTISSLAGSYLGAEVDRLTGNPLLGSTVGSQFGNFVNKLF